MNQTDPYAPLEAARLAGARIYGVAADGSLHVVGAGELKPQYSCPPDRYVALVPAEKLAELSGLAARAIPFLEDAGAEFEDDGHNEPLELAREIREAANA